MDSLQRVVARLASETVPRTGFCNFSQFFHFSKLPRPSNLLQTHGFDRKVHMHKEFQVRVQDWMFESKEEFHEIIKIGFSYLDSPIFETLKLSEFLTCRKFMVPIWEVMILVERKRVNEQSTRGKELKLLSCFILAWPINGLIAW
jgi:hypothetical protein